MLKLKNYSIFSLHVRDMLFTAFRQMNYLLPLFGKLAFPSAMPRCFRLPPMVLADAASLIRPTPYSDIPTLCDHCSAANGASGRQASPSFATLSFNVGKLHLISPHGQSALNRQFDRAAVPRRETASALCWFLLLVSVGQRNSVAGCKMTTVAPPYDFSPQHIP
jgi:hypothetical protein